MVRPDHIKTSHGSNDKVRMVKMQEESGGAVRMVSSRVLKGAPT